MGFDTTNPNWVVSRTGYYSITFNVQVYNRSNVAQGNMFSYISMNGSNVFRRCYLKILYTTNQNMNMDINAACMY